MSNSDESETSGGEQSSPSLKIVVWTKLGEAMKAHSEQGTHAEGDLVETLYSDILIERGFATAGETT